jgi:hypothetical protein
MHRATIIILTAALLLGLAATTHAEVRRGDGGADTFSGTPSATGTGADVGKTSCADARRTTTFTAAAGRTDSTPVAARTTSTAGGATTG